MKHTFAFWLRLQAHRNDGIGDLAKDFKADHRARRLQCFTAVKKHLIEMGACDGAMDALEIAGQEYILLRGVRS